MADIERWFHRRRARSCGRKRRYGDERDAQDAAYLIRLQTGERLTAYRCSFCGQWHLGHPARASARASSSSQPPP